jgi:aryl-alcohol dehydrogenase-like predicted oxidoreductase
MSKVKHMTTEEALPVFRAFVESGGDFIDTANVYCRDYADLGHNERLVAACLKELGNPPVKVATKGGNSTPDGIFPPSLRAACEGSLKALGVEQIFLYQLHFVDPRYPLADSIGELTRLQQEGKIRHIGVSNVNPQQFMEARAAGKIASVQNRCNLFWTQDLQNGLIQYCASNHIAYIAYAPFGGIPGTGIGGPGHRVEMGQIESVARSYGVTPYRFMLACLLQFGSIIPIPGASSVSSVKDNAEAFNVRLSEEHKTQLSAMWNMRHSHEICCSEEKALRCCNYRIDKRMLIVSLDESPYANAEELRYYLRRHWADKFEIVDLYRPMPRFLDLLGLYGNDHQHIAAGLIAVQGPSCDLARQTPTLPVYRVQDHLQDYDHSWRELAVWMNTLQTGAAFDKE